MSSGPADVAGAAGRGGIDDCWNRIGVRGDASCPQLAEHVHCRNCPVHAAAAARLLGVALPPGHLDYWTRHVAQPRAVEEPDTHSVLVFRVGAEWLALPTALFKEIAARRAIHSIPHRGGAVLGLVNIRGELLACISLWRILGIERDAERKEAGQRALEERLLVIEGASGRMACPVDEVHGILRYHPRELNPTPATIARTPASYTRAVLPWRNQSVGLLDQELLCHTVDRSLSSATAT